MVTLAEGTLELTAPAGALDYPIGLAQEVTATRVAAEHLPPYDVEPWIDFEDLTVAFHINPVGVECEEDITFRVLGEAFKVDTTFDVWSVHDTQGVLELVGSASVDEGGAIVSAEGLPLRTLTTLLLIASQP